MTITHALPADTFDPTHSIPRAYPETSTTGASAVSWAAILAGAAGAAALSLILLILGVGLGLSSVSPWSNAGVSATTLGASTIAWLAFTQLAASGMGGYLAGRLRTKWAAAHTDEVYFRDTAHGFLAWAVASLVSAALLSSVIGSIVGGAAKAGAAAAGGVAATAAVSAASGAAAAEGAATFGSEGQPMGYFVDSLFRKDLSATPGDPVAGTAAEHVNASSSEVVRVFANSIRSGPLPAEDVRYVGQLVALRTGLPQPEAEKRVSEAYEGLQSRLREAQTAAQAAADSARKASAYAALWLFVSLLAGAFVASLAATYGGRRRDA